MKQLLDKLITIIKTKDTLVVLAVIIINVLFRLINIDKYDLWYDELFSLFWAQYDKIEEVINVSYWDVAPPGYNIIVHYWIKTFGISAFSIRFLSCLAMSISAGVVYFISKKTFGLKTALIVFILFLTNSNLFYYSQEGRGYACQMLLVSISSLIFLSLLKENKWYLSLFYSILLGSINYYLFYTHFATLFLFVGQTFFAIIYFKNNLLNWYVVSVGVLVYWLTPFLPRVLELIKSNGQNFWLAKPQ